MIHDMVENPNWQEADQLATYTKRDREFELGTTENKSSLWQGGGLESGTSGLQHQRPKPLGHANSTVVSCFPLV